MKVVAGEDADATTDPDVTLVHAIGSTQHNPDGELRATPRAPRHTVYDALADQSVTVSITENDAVGVSITPTNLTIDEGDACGGQLHGGADHPAHRERHRDHQRPRRYGPDPVRYDAHQQRADLHHGQNWDTAQTVKVVAAEDDDADQDAEVTLVHAIGSTADSVYDALADQSVTVSITENDEVGVTINPTTLTVTEGDATGNSYTVVLATQPTGNVTVTISGHSGTDLTVSGTTLTNNVLTFTTDNWDTVQTVKVVAGEDADATTDPDVTLVHAIGSTADTVYDLTLSGTDAEQRRLADQSVSVTVSITENDVVGVTINPTTLTVTEGDAAGASYTVVLTSQPAGDVTIAISGHADTDLTLSGTTLTNNVLTFTTDNWDTVQTVKVVAGEDADATTDPDVTLVHAIGSTADTVYDALADQSVTVSITENDVVGVTINPTTLTVNEGDAMGASYAVTLTSQPAGDVTIAISGQAGTDLTLSGTSLSNDGELTFTTENWGTAQTVKVKAAEDGDADQDADVTLVHAIGSTADTDYNALADQSVTVSITENDVVGVTINPTTLTVNEGDAAGPATP